MKDLKHIRRFNESDENLNISDVRSSKINESMDDMEKEIINGQIDYAIQVLKSMFAQMKKIYNNKWFPRLFYIKPDGGKDSGVTGYFLIEWKPFFSIGLLHFKEGSREAYHNHAFNALTWWIKGKVTEAKLNASFNNKNLLNEKYEDITKDYEPSLLPKFTSRDNFHRVIAHKDTYALTFRGPWNDTWNEFRKNRIVTLTHGREEVVDL